MTTWRIKHIHEEPSDAGGYRVPVDWLWPRGVSKKVVHLDEWRKDVAPSTEARRNFGHDPAWLGEFKARYRTELAASGAARALAERLVGQPVVTLLYAVHNPNIDQMMVLQEVLSDPQVTS